MKHKIRQIIFTPELKTSVYNAFAEHAIESIKYNGLSKDSVAFEILENDLSLGICVCQLFWGNFHIKYLMINKEHRGRRLGRTLMKHAFDFGKKDGCRFAFIETMSFQALEFYQKLGFQIEFKRDGYAVDTSLYFLRKDLTK